MKVTIKLFASLRELLPEGSDGNSCGMDLSEGTTVGEVLDSLEVPGDIKLIILLNGVHAGRETALSAGDTLSVFPPVAGG